VITFKRGKRDGNNASLEPHCRWPETVKTVGKLLDIDIRVRRQTATVHTVLCLHFSMCRTV